MDYFLLRKNLPPSFDVLIPFYQFEDELIAELALQSKTIYYKNDKILIVESLVIKPIWSQDWWRGCHTMALESKSQLIKFLRSKPVMGFYYEASISKFGKNLLSELRHLERKRIKPNSKFNFKYFSWTALEDCIVYCDNPASAYPGGWHEFEEDKDFPPNRAYLKLWELFTVYKLNYNPDDSVIDVGASPGGWSWVLSQHFKKVYSVDKAPLDPKILQISNIAAIAADAFKINYNDFKDCSWIFSDIICTPDKSYELINQWIANSFVQNFVCTLKFKGPCDFDILKKCLSVEGSTLIHLYQNKNEVTWLRQKL